MKAPKPQLRTFPLLAFSLGIAGALAAQTCAPPPELRPKAVEHPSADEMKEIGIWFAGQQKYACAADAFAASLQTDPRQREVAHVAFMFGGALYLSGDVAEAIPSLQKAEELGYRSEDLHVLLATALEATQARAAAEDEWRKVLLFDPESTQGLDALSNDLMADGKYEATIDLLETPRVLGQRSVQQCLNLATAYSKIGKSDKALAVLEDGWNTWVDSAEIAKTLAATLQQLGRSDEAAAVLKIADSRSADR